MKRTPHRSLRTRSAFSLVEVAMALGIFSFAIVGLVGLLPVGLNAFKESKNASIYANILSQRLGEVNQTPYSVLAGNSATSAKVANLVFYTEEGIPVQEKAHQSVTSLRATDYPASAIYAASVTLTKGVALPVNGGASMESESVLRAVVNISQIASPGKAVSFPALVANLGK